MTAALVKALANLKAKEALEETKARLESGQSPIEILEDATRGMKIVGERFAKEEYFIPDLVYSGQILQEITEIVKPQLDEKGHTKVPRGTFLIGTVAGDIHDIGKDLVVFMLDVNEFEVYDLGVDVPPITFVDKIRELGPDIVGLSALITVAFDSLKKTIDAIVGAGLRDKVKIVIGGSQVDEQVKEYCGADAFCRDAMCGVSLAKAWIGGR